SRPRRKHSESRPDRAHSRRDDRPRPRSRAPDRRTRPSQLYAAQPPAGAVRRTRPRSGVVLSEGTAKPWGVTAIAAWIGNDPQTLGVTTRPRECSSRALSCPGFSLRRAG